MLNVKEWLSSMKSSKPDPSIPQCVPRLALRRRDSPRDGRYMTPGGPEPMFVMRLPDGPELKVSPENIRPGFKWLAKKHPSAFPCAALIVRTRARSCGSEHTREHASHTHTSRAFSRAHARSQSRVEASPSLPKLRSRAHSALHVPDRTPRLCVLIFDAV